MTNRGGENLDYNGRGQLLSYGSVLSLTYDPMGRVTRRVFGSEIKNWCAGGDIECSDSGAWLKLDLGRAVLDLSTGQDHLYRHRDSRGNVLFTTDSNGVPQTHSLYGAYGLLEQEGSSSDREARFALGIDFGDIMIIGARVYDQAAGRFLSPDPIPNHINAYSYTLGNPVEVSDTSGRNGQCITAGFCYSDQLVGSPGPSGLADVPDEITVFGEKSQIDNDDRMAGFWAWFRPSFWRAAIQAGRLGSQAAGEGGGPAPVDVSPPAQNPAPIIRPMGPVKPPKIRLPNGGTITPKGFSPYFSPYPWEPIA